jgi:hypothetical protein
MTMTITTIATDPTARNSSAVSDRFSAVSWGLGPCHPDSTSSRAIRVDFAYSRVARAIAAAAIAQSTIAAIAQPCHGCSCGRRRASQMPRAIAPGSPTAIAPVATIVTGLKLNVASGSGAVQSATTRIHDMNNPPTSVAANNK